MRYIPVETGVREGETISNGYSGGYLTAPEEPGEYTLYEIADDKNCHVGWKWEKEQ